MSNVCSTEKVKRHSSVLLLCLVTFSAEQMLIYIKLCFHSIILDLHFPAICYKKLLTPPVVPANEDAPVGIVTSPSLDDLAAIMPDVAHSLREVLDYRGKFTRFLGIIY